MVKTQIQYPLRLVGPWYRWQRQKAILGLGPRESRPSLQMYNTAEAANRFLEDPQRSLVFTFEDVVQQLKKSTAPRPIAGFNDRILVPDPTGTRKLFLSMHKRFYLVVCELHCDVPGFPDAKRKEICEMGFVVRRRYLVFPEAIKAQVHGAWAELARLNARLYKLDRRAASRLALSGKSLVKRVAAQQFDASYAGLRQQLKSQTVAIEERFKEWRRLGGGSWVVQGWFPAEFEGIGQWKVVPSEPDEVVERVYPVYPLVPDPRVSDHSSFGATLLFGMVPTGGSDAAERGEPQFDDQSVYEIRCFVRQHDTRCSKTNSPGDCPGRLIWSKSTEAYRLASHFDAAGTSHCVVDVQMPDLRELAAQVAALPPGTSASVRFQSPEDSVLAFSVDEDNNPVKIGLASEPACFFSIPLITIVATFVLNLFMPIVVFLFQLYYLLPLRICLPPAFPGLGESLDSFLGPGLSRGSSSAALAAFGAQTNVMGTTKRAELLELLSEFLTPPAGKDYPWPDRFSFTDLIEIGYSLASHVDARETASRVTNLQYEPLVEPRPAIDEEPFVDAQAETLVGQGVT